MKLKPTISLLAAAGMLLFVSACQSGGHEEVGAPVVAREDSLRIFLENLLAPRLPGEETTFFDALMSTSTRMGTRRLSYT